MQFGDASSASESVALFHAWAMTPMRATVSPTATHSLTGLLMAYGQNLFELSSDCGIGIGPEACAGTVLNASPAIRISAANSAVMRYFIGFPPFAPAPGVGQPGVCCSRCPRGHPPQTVTRA